MKQLFRFLAWEFTRFREDKKLPPELRRELERVENDGHPIPCPFCNLPFASGRSFRWHVSGCEKQKDFQ